jgi:hypothetical protein
MTRPTAPRRRCFVLLWSLATGLASAACQVETRGAADVGLGPDQGVELDATPTDAAPPPRPDADAPPDANPDAMPEPLPPDAALPAGPLCLPGQFPAFGGVCRGAGVPRCHPMWRQPDGTCAPELAGCGPDERPDLTAGCVHVGLPECDDAFKDATGRCRPRFASCPPGTRPDGSSTCISTEADSACDESAWARFADNADHVVVAPDGDDTTADGTRAHPYGTIAAGIAAVGDWHTVVLAPGEYHEQVALTHTVIIEGLCRDGVVVAAPAARNAPAWRESDLVQGATAFWSAGAEYAHLTHMTIRADGAAYAAGPGETTLDDVRVTGAAHNAVVAADGHWLHLHGVEFDALRESAYGRNEQWGVIRGMRGAVVTVQRGVLHGIAAPAASLHGVATRLIAEDTLFDDVGNFDHDDAGLITAPGNASFECTRCAFAATRSIVGGSGSDARTALRDSVAFAFARHGDRARTTRALRLENGARGVLANTVIDGAFGLAALASDWAELTATGNLITDVPATTTDEGIGLWLRNGAAGDLRDNFVQGAAGAAIVVSNEHIDRTTRIDAAGDVLRGLDPTLPGLGHGYGLYLQGRADATLDSSVVRGTRGAGLLAYGPAIQARIFDSEIVDTLPGRFATGPDLGLGLGAIFGPTLSIAGLRVLRPTGVGVFLSGAGTTATLDSTWVDTPRPADTLLADGTRLPDVADGVVVAHHAEAHLRDGLARGAARAGIVFDDATGDVTAMRGEDNGVDLRLQGERRPNFTALENELRASVEAAALGVPDGEAFRMDDE